MKNLRLLFNLVATALLLHLNVSAQLDQSTEVKINDLIKKMTLEEKVSMIHANSGFTSADVQRLGIPEIEWKKF